MRVVAVVLFVVCVHSVLNAGRVVVADLQERVLSAVCEQLANERRPDDD